MPRPTHQVASRRHGYRQSGSKRILFDDFDAPARVSTLVGAAMEPKRRIDGLIPIAAGTMLAASLRWRA